jgi:hypothetical protein
MQPSLIVIFVVAAAFPVSRTARGDDSPSAIDELKQGYALKQSGHCAEAIPHFLASYRADPQPKALLNLADCEAQMGDLIAAQGHATQGRRLALQKSDPELSNVADTQLADIDKKLPRLTIRLGPGAPPACAVSRDGAPVDATMLGLPIGVNAGVHALVASAAGYAQRRFEVTLDIGASEEVEVQPGPKLGAEGAAGPAAIREPPKVVQPDHARGKKTLAYAAIGVGAIGLGVGVVGGLAAASKHGSLVRDCDGNDCPLTEQSELGAFRALRTVSTIGYLVGFAGLVGGVVLWVVAPPDRPGTGSASVWVGPTSAGVSGRF